MGKISRSQQKARKKAEEQLRKLLNNEMPPLGVTLTYGADVMNNDKEKYTAAVMLDGYLKNKTEELPEPMQRFIFIGIREIVKNISPEFREKNEEKLKGVISSEEDWTRFQSVQD